MRGSQCPRPHRARTRAHGPGSKSRILSLHDSWLLHDASVTLHPQVHTAHSPPGRTDRLGLSTAYPNHCLLVWPNITSPAPPRSWAPRRGSGSEGSSRIAQLCRTSLGDSTWSVTYLAGGRGIGRQSRDPHQGGGGGGHSSRPTLLRSPPPQAAWEASMPFGGVFLRNNVDGIYECASWDHC